LPGDAAGLNIGVMTYDAVVVGARCAGAPTAMLLARQGLRVLLVDKAAFPSEILKGHVIKPAGVARLARWGLLDDLLATGCPPIRHTRIRFAHSPGCSDTDERTPGQLNASPAWAMSRQTFPPNVQLLTPRRHVLDWVLVQGAIKSGAEFRDRSSLTNLIWEDGRVTGVELGGPRGERWRERCSVVVGADGVRSRVARLVGSEVTAAWPAATVAYWAYWSGITWNPPTTDLLCDGRLMGASPTHGGESLMFVQIPVTRVSAVRRDRVSEYDAAMAVFAGDLLHGATRTTRVFGVTELPNYFRRSHGPGWVLVGDAGHHKDPLAARGIVDAFRDAEAAAEAIAAGLDVGHLDRRLGAYETARDQSSYEVAERNAVLARMDRPVEELMGDWAALADAEARADADLLAAPPVGARAGSAQMSRSMSDPADVAASPISYRPLWRQARSHQEGGT
jgi:2-polyprenyl-6-methoxyphenol hydroxylase-like FAD-dependent oxidoreductase